jgi:spore coat polysaccharide biosynthesis protein SpsF
VQLCDGLGIKCYRGSENDVLSRVLEAAKWQDADLICELMGDSPCLDPLLIDYAISAHLSGNYDYTANFLPENTLPMGFAVQVFGLDVLAKVDSLTDDPIDRVHVSCFIYHNPKIFKLQGVPTPLQLAAPQIRLCLDTKEDYELLSKVWDALYKPGECFRAVDAVNFLIENPGLLNINQHVRQKHIDEG